MKKLIFCLALMLMASLSPAQITQIKKAQPQKTESNLPYDSLSNFLGDDVKKYIGQELFLLPIEESLRILGYDRFVIDYKKSDYDRKNRYKWSTKGNYEALVNKYFIVLDIIPHPRAGESSIYSSKCFLKLKEKESNDIVYYSYDGKFSSTFKFITVAYFEKMKRLYKGQELIWRGKPWGQPPMKDVETGNIVDFPAGITCKIIDVSLDAENGVLLLILQNDKNEKIGYSVYSAQKDETYSFTKSQAKTYLEKFGEKNWNSILGGNVSIGMTQEMCLIAWGQPQKVNETITASGKTEQWVYKTQYLYFENGILKTIQ